MGVRAPEAIAACARGVRGGKRGGVKDTHEGPFARNWTAEYKAGLQNYKKDKQADLDHPIEGVGAKRRAGMTCSHSRIFTKMSIA